MDKDQKDFLEDKKESIGLVIYQISQLDKSVTQLTERLDVMIGRLEQRVQSLELWKAGFTQKIATQEQLDSLRSDFTGMKNFILGLASFIAITIIAAILKTVLKI